MQLFFLGICRCWCPAARLLHHPVLGTRGTQLSRGWGLLNGVLKVMVCNGMFSLEQGALAAFVGEGVLAHFNTYDPVGLKRDVHLSASGFTAVFLVELGL